jgi:two-component system KDP operon response regulator KdpE
MVLLIEDEGSIASAIASALEDEGLRVRIAANGREGLDAAFALIPDVIVLDLKLPDYDGRDLLRTLKSYLRTRPIPIVVCSVSPGLLTPEDYDDVTAIVSKPFDLNRLVKTIHLASK